MSNDAIIKVRGQSKCGLWSDWNYCTITRYVQPPCPISGAPDFVVCDDVNPFVVSASVIQNVQGYNYHWILPNGWTGSNTGTSTTITPSGNSEGTLQLFASAYGKESTRCAKFIKLEKISPTSKVSGPNFICDSENANFTIGSSFPVSSNISWTVFPPNTVSPSAGTGITANFNPIYGENGKAVIKFNINNNCGSASLQKQFFVGLPSNPVIDISFDPCLHLVTLEDINNAPSLLGNWSWLWSVQSGNQLKLASGNPTNVHIPLLSTTPVNVEVSVTNSCGSSEAFLSDNPPVCSSNPGFKISISPNPISSYLNIDIVNLENYSDVINGYLEIYDSKGNLKLRHTVSSKNTTLNLVDEIRDLYFIKYISADGISTVKTFIKNQ
ncbi:MAG: T9SS type A sorting domain-containing protein [Bacteroidota bacterium]|nr:T9SS type A sorting domain-containing protein [Bacteroidota bacterium]